MNLTNYGRGLAYSSLLTLTIGTAACASAGRVGNLEDTVNNINGRITRVEKTSLPESPIMLTKDKYPVEFGMLFARVLDQYKNADSRKFAEQEANALMIYPTVDPNSYWVLVMHDGNAAAEYADGKPTQGQDRTYPDGSGEGMRVGFYMDLLQIPSQVQFLLPHLRDVGQK